MARSLDVDECRQALRNRFARGNGFIYLEELATVGGLPNSEGMRRADFWAMSVYGSRGYETHGVEIKVSRSDLRAELKEPEKAEALASFCDYWWLAVGDREILDGVRVPKSWGVLWPRGDNLVQKEEPTRTDSDNHWDRAFVAALVKKCWNPYGTTRIRQLKEQHRQELRTQTREARAAGRDRERERWESFEARVKAFEKASGIDLLGSRFTFSKYGVREDVGRSLGRAVRVLMNGSGDLESHLSSMRKLARQARERAGRIEETADGLEEFVDDLQDRQLDLLQGEEGAA